MCICFFPRPCLGSAIEEAKGEREDYLGIDARPMQRLKVLDSEWIVQNAEAFWKRRYIVLLRSHQKGLGNEYIVYLEVYC